MGSPVMSISIATVHGIWRGRRTVEPDIGNSPRCTSLTAIWAPSAATRTSKAWRISMPPA